MTPSEKILADLIGFATVSRDSNLELIHYLRDFLAGLGVDSEIVANAEGDKANLYAVIGPGRAGGVMLSGHTDVVPVDNQSWSVDPFCMSERDGRLYGRGATDMKGFIASALAMVEKAVKRELKSPLHLAFSHDEEIGCVGVRSLIQVLEGREERPAFCIIGEPTSLRVAAAHKGKTAARCRCHGVEAHSALADQGLNAIFMACEMINGLRIIQHDLESGADRGGAGFSVPHSTLHVGVINGGGALNIIPNYCEFSFELRNVQRDDPAQVMQRIHALAGEVRERHARRFERAAVDIEVFNEYPALDTPADADIVHYVNDLVRGEGVVKLDFGTEGGLFQQRLNLPTVVCGPGSMEQGHKPDEYIERAELARCDAFLERLLARLCAEPGGSPAG